MFVQDMKTKMNFSYRYQITLVWILWVLSLLMHCVGNHAFYSGESVHFSELYPEVIYINTVLFTSIDLLWLTSAQLNKQKHILLAFILLWVLGTVRETRRITLFCDVFVWAGSHIIPYSTKENHFVNAFHHSLFSLLYDSCWFCHQTWNT